MAPRADKKMHTGSGAGQRRFDLWEMTLLLLLAVGITWVLAEARVRRVMQSVPPPFHSQEDEQLDVHLRRQYGPSRSSIGVEEWVIRDFFLDRRGGVFVDVGAWEWQRGSNTYFLERKLGWAGLAIDASPEHFEGWRVNRPRSQFVVAFVDEVDGESRLFYAGANSLTSSSTRSVPDQFGGGTVAEHRVPTARLDTLLERAGVTRIDLLNMDIEMGEPAALRGFSIDRYRPALVCIEAHMQVRADILKYFASAGYVVVGKYLRYDTDNLYFEPLNVPSLVKPPSTAQRPK